jgi:phage terminase Nu1 subunit (DNA packaging protein)
MMKKGKTEQFLSISALARLLGVDRRTVTKRLEGVPPVREGARERLYRLQDAVQAFVANPTNEEKRPSGGGEAKLRKSEAEANLLELRLAREREEVVSIHEVGDEIQEVFKRLYQRLAVQYPREIAAQLYKAESPGQITDIMRHDMGRFFNELRNDYTHLFREGEGAQTDSGD